jgi:hypothetical protein
MKRYQLVRLDMPTSRLKRLQQRSLEQAVLNDVPEVGLTHIGSIKHQRAPGGRRDALMPDAHPLIRTKPRHGMCAPVLERVAAGAARNVTLGPLVTKVRLSRGAHVTDTARPSAEPGAITRALRATAPINKLPRPRRLQNALARARHSDHARVDRRTNVRHLRPMRLKYRYAERRRCASRCSPRQ